MIWVKIKQILITYYRLYKPVIKKWVKGLIKNCLITLCIVAIIAFALSEVKSFKESGGCFSVMRKMSFDEIYKKAKYHFITSKIEWSNKMIDKYSKCKENNCGVYYLENKSLADSIKHFNTNPDKFIKLNKKNDFYNKNINGIYIRDYDGMGTIYIFHKLYKADDPILKSKTIPNKTRHYYMGITMNNIDEYGHIYDEHELNTSYIAVDNCGDFPFLYLGD